MQELASELVVVGNVWLMAIFIIFQYILWVLLKMTEYIITRSDWPGWIFCISFYEYIDYNAVFDIIL